MPDAQNMWEDGAEVLVSVLVPTLAFFGGAAATFGVLRALDPLGARKITAPAPAPEPPGRRLVGGGGLAGGGGTAPPSGGTATLGATQVVRGEFPIPQLGGTPPLGWGPAGESPPVARIAPGQTKTVRIRVTVRASGGWEGSTVIEGRFHNVGTHLTKLEGPGPREAVIPTNVGPWVATGFRVAGDKVYVAAQSTPTPVVDQFAASEITFEGQPPTNFRAVAPPAIAGKKITNWVLTQWTASYQGV